MNPSPAMTVQWHLAWLNSEINCLLKTRSAGGPRPWSILEERIVELRRQRDQLLREQREQEAYE